MGPDPYYIGVSMELPIPGDLWTQTPPVAQAAIQVLMEHYDKGVAAGLPGAAAD
jgi:hypothetical protein